MGEKIFASVEVYGFLTISIASFVRTDRSARLLCVDLHGLAKVKIGSRSAMFAFYCLLIIGCNYRKSEKACKKQTMIIFVPRLSLYFFYSKQVFFHASESLKFNDFDDPFNFFVQHKYYAILSSRALRD